MKFVIFIILFAGASFAFPPSGPSFAQLSILSDIADDIENVAGVLKDINGYISSTGDASIITKGVNEATTAVNDLSGALTEVAISISSGQSLSGVKRSFQDWLDAGNEVYASYANISDNPGSIGSFADVVTHASSLESLAGAYTILIGVVDSLSADSAVAFGNAAQSNDLINSLKTVSEARSNLVATISAVAFDSDHAYELNIFANAEDSVSSGEYDLASAFNDAANK